MQENENYLSIDPFEDEEQGQISRAKAREHALKEETAEIQSENVSKTIKALGIVSTSTFFLSYMYLKMMKSKV
jgi:hypothetical protein